MHYFDFFISGVSYRAEHVCEPLVVFRESVRGRVQWVSGHVGQECKAGKGATDLNGIWFILMMVFFCFGLCASSGSFHLPG